MNECAVDLVHTRRHISGRVLVIIVRVGCSFFDGLIGADQFGLFVVAVLLLVLTETLFKRLRVAVGWLVLAPFAIALSTGFRTAPEVFHAVPFSGFVDVAARVDVVEEPLRLHQFLTCFRHGRRPRFGVWLDGHWVRKVDVLLLPFHFNFLFQCFNLGF